MAHGPIALRYPKGHRAMAMSEPRYWKVAFSSKLDKDKFEDEQI